MIGREQTQPSSPVHRFIQDHLPDGFSYFHAGFAIIFFYDSLGVETGRIGEDEWRANAARWYGSVEAHDWWEKRVQKACDISPIRVMQIAQVGL